MADGSSPLPSDSDQPAQSSPETLISHPKKSRPLPWTPQETINLIQSYRDKWYSLNRGQLKGSQWEEVAVTVVARCDFDELSKSATQCRHKIEKLRKRYRAERLKPYPNSWPLFPLMDDLQRGPLPIAARPITMVKYHKLNHGSNGYDEDSDNEELISVDLKKNKSKSINHIVSAKVGVNGSRNMNSISRGKNLGYELRKGNHENEPNDDEGEEDEGVDEDKTEDEDGDRQLVAEIRSFADRFMRMEKKKIEMMRDNGRYRMEMEKRRIDMILEAQRKISDSVSRMLEPNKRVKMEH